MRYLNISIQFSGKISFNLENFSPYVLITSMTFDYDGIMSPMLFYLFSPWLRIFHIYKEGK